MESSLLINSNCISIFKSKKCSLILENICIKLSSLFNMGDEADGIIRQANDICKFISDCLHSIDDYVKSGTFGSDETCSKMLASLQESRQELECLSTNLRDTTDTANLYTNDKQSWINLIHLQSKEILSLVTKMLNRWEELKVADVKMVTRDLQCKIHNFYNHSETKQLIPVFKEFVVDAIKLLTKLDDRKSDVTDADRLSSIGSFILLIRSACVTLGKIFKLVILYPRNPHSKARLEFGLHKVNSVITDLVDYFESSEHLYEPRSSSAVDGFEEPGHFITKIDMLSDLLSPGQRRQLDNKLEMLTDVTIEYCMTVAHLARPADKAKVTEACQKILNMKRDVMELQKKHQVDGNHESRLEFSSEFDVICDSLRDEFRCIEKLIVAVVMKTLTDTFIRVNDPLENLLDAGIKLWDNKGDSEVDASLMEPYIESFANHADKLNQVTLFSVACCTDLRKASIILSLLSTVEKLDPEVIPAIIIYLKTDRIMYDSSYIEYLRILHHLWKEETDDLYRALLSVTETQKMVQICYDYVIDIIQHLQNSFSSGNSEMCVERMKMLLGCCKQVEKLVDLIPSEVIRNSLETSKLQLKKAQVSFRKKELKYASNTSDEVNQRKLIKCGKIAASCVKNVNIQLLEVNHATTDEICSYRTREDIQNGNWSVGDNKNMEQVVETSKRFCNFSDLSVTGNVISNYSFEDILEEIDSLSISSDKISHDVDQQILKADIVVENNVRCIRKSNRYKSFLNNMSDQSKSMYQSAISIVSKSLLEHTENIDVSLWEEDENVMVTVAIELCKLLDRLSLLHEESVNHDDLLKILDEVKLKSEQLSSYACSLAEISSSRKNVDELKYRSEQVLSACNQLKIIFSMACIGSTSKCTFEQVFHILPKFSVNVKRDINCLLHLVEENDSTKTKPSLSRFSNITRVCNPEISRNEEFKTGIGESVR